MKNKKIIRPNISAEIWSNANWKATNQSLPRKHECIGENEFELTQIGWVHTFLMRCRFSLCKNWQKSQHIQHVDFSRHSSMGTSLLPFANKNFSKQVARHRATTSVTTTEFAFISTKRPCTGHIDVNRIVRITTESAADLFNSILCVEFVQFSFGAIQKYIFHSLEKLDRPLYFAMWLCQWVSVEWMTLRPSQRS